LCQSRFRPLTYYGRAELERGKSSFSSNRDCRRKGINVARAIKQKGGNPRLLIFEGGSTGEKIKKGLEKENFLFTSWPSDETRITTIIHEEKTKRHTVINEPGPLVSISTTLACLHFLENNLRRRLSGTVWVSTRGVRLDFHPFAPL